MICLLPTSPRKIRNGRSAVTPRPLLNPTTMKGSGESMGNRKATQTKSKCSFCGNSFLAVRCNQLYCCVKCRRDAKNSRSFEYRKVYNEKHKEKKSQYMKKWATDNAEHVKNYRLTHKERDAAINKKWRQDNSEHLAAYQVRYCKEQSEKVLRARKKYNTENAEKILISQKRYRDENRLALSARRKTKKSRAVKNAYRKQKRIESPSYRLREMLRQRQYHAIAGKQKSGSAVQDMGCTAQEACDYLESLFDEHMTWDNWGTYWHLDHIFPLAKANMEDRVEYLAVSNWRNLQPLEEKANIAKGDKVTPAARRLFNKLVKEFS